MASPSPRSLRRDDMPPLDSAPAGRERATRKPFEGGQGVNGLTAFLKGEFSVGAGLECLNS